MLLTIFGLNPEVVSALNQGRTKVQPSGIGQRYSKDDITHSLPNARSARSKSSVITVSADAILRNDSKEYGASVGIRTRF